MTLELGAHAAEISARHGIRGCDAVYVALAEARGDELVTFDRLQFDRGAEVVRTRRP